MNLEKTLTNYGLTKKQAKLYLACLELGSASVYKISKKAEMPRSTAYETLEILRKKNLVSTFHNKKVKFYNAEDPKDIIRNGKEKIEMLEEALPQFSAFYGEAKNKPTVRFYQGRIGMKTILKEILSEADELLSFSSADELFATLGDYWPKFLEERIKRKIMVRVILRDSQKAQERRRLGPEELREVRIMPGTYKHNGLVMIWKDKICMFSFQKDLTALVVEGEGLAQIQKAMFNFMWDTLK